MDFDVNDDVDNYNEVIIHETLRVAVIGILQEDSVDASNMPMILKHIMSTYFLTNYQSYENLIKSQLRQDGKQMIDPFGDKRPPTFQYGNLMEGIVHTKKILEENSTENYVDGFPKAKAKYYDILKDVVTKYFNSDIPRAIDYHTDSDNDDDDYHECVNSSSLIITYDSDEDYET